MTSLRKTAYHHGDLRNALLDAAVAHAASGGPEAVTIRGVAKTVGVTPTAAYRHFASHDDLLAAIKDRAMDALGDAMRSRLARLDADPAAAFAAVQHLATLGHGYVAFARESPGVFATAFCKEGFESHGPDHPHPTPFLMLEEAIDHLVEVGYLLPQSRPLAEMSAWATVHGLATMLVDGVLGDVPDEERAAIVDRTLLMVVAGLGDGPAASSVDLAAAVGRSVR